MKVERALSVIDSLREGWYGPPMFYFQKKIEFEYKSYQYSALEEIKRHLIRHNKEDPIKMIEDFRCQMDCFALEAKNPTENFMFSTYYDVATDVLDILLGHITLIH